VRFQYGQQTRSTDLREQAVKNSNLKFRLCKGTLTPYWLMQRSVMSPQPIGSLIAAAQQPHEIWSWRPAAGNTWLDAPVNLTQTLQWERKSHLLMVWLAAALECRTPLQLAWTGKHGSSKIYTFSLSFWVNFTVN
jgi:hypothetical protein